MNALLLDRVGPLGPSAVDLGTLVCMEIDHAEKTILASVRVSGSVDVINLGSIDGNGFYRVNVTHEGQSIQVSYRRMRLS